MGVEEIAIVIVNWNGRQLTLDCLDSLVRAGFPLENVILVDNGSSDGSGEAVKVAFPDAQIIKLTENRGFTGGNNAGLRHVLSSDRYRFVVLLNNDTCVTPGLFEHLLAHFAVHPEVGVVQPKLVRFDGETLDSTGHFADTLGMTLARGALAPANATWPPRGFFYASGACLMARESVFRDVGFLDEEMFAYHEDIDWCWRARLLGVEIEYVDSAVCFHKGSATAGTSPEKISVIWRNRYRTLCKNYSLPSLAIKLPEAMIVSFVYATSLAVGFRKIRFFRHYFGGLLWNVQHARSTIRARKDIQGSRKVGDQRIRAHMLPQSVELRLLCNRLLGRRSIGDNPSTVKRAESEMNQKES